MMIELLVYGIMSTVVGLVYTSINDGCQYVLSSVSGLPVLVVYLLGCSVSFHSPDLCPGQPSSEWTFLPLVVHSPPTK